jgi:hypothetical protein
MKICYLKSKWSPKSNLKANMLKFKWSSENLRFLVRWHVFSRNWAIWWGKWIEHPWHSTALWIVSIQSCFSVVISLEPYSWQCQNNILFMLTWTFLIHFFNSSSELIGFTPTLFLQSQSVPLLTVGCLHMWLDSKVPPSKLSLCSSCRGLHLPCESHRKVTAQEVLSPPDFLLIQACTTWHTNNFPHSDEEFYYCRSLVHLYDWYETGHLLLVS